MRCTGHGDIWLLVDRILGNGVKYFFLKFANPGRLDSGSSRHSQLPRQSKDWWDT